MDLKVADGPMLTIEGKEILKNTRRRVLTVNVLRPMGLISSKVSCEVLVNDWSYQAEEGPTELCHTMAYSLLTSSNSEIVDKCKIGLGYNVVPPPYIGNFMPPKPNLSFSGLEEFTSESIVIKHVVENSEAKASEAKPKEVRKNNSAPIIED
ncbi:hypothetical protein Tco_0892657 [Tanacetum coccineum]|uniref:Uncharacterized protein n=1 Tax=Tanacetum coccineum TaxID=301880 RepID=A0ABQ5C6J1_9ASTR